MSTKIWKVSVRSQERDFHYAVGEISQEGNLIAFTRSDRSEKPRRYFAAHFVSMIEETSLEEINDRRLSKPDHYDRTPWTLKNL